MLNLLERVGDEFICDPLSGWFRGRQIDSVNDAKLNRSLFKDRSDAAKQKASLGIFSWASGK
jgi:hypothetical protein